MGPVAQSPAELQQGGPELQLGDVFARNAPAAGEDDAPSPELWIHSHEGALVGAGHLICDKADVAAAMARSGQEPSHQGLLKAPALVSLSLVSNIGHLSDMKVEATFADLLAGWKASKPALSDANVAQQPSHSVGVEAVAHQAAADIVLLVRVRFGC